jgi:hypothetical protein
MNSESKLFGLGEKSRSTGAEVPPGSKVRWSEERSDELITPVVMTRNGTRAPTSVQAHLTSTAAERVAL